MAVAGTGVEFCSVQFASDGAVPWGRLDGDDAGDFDAGGDQRSPPNARL